MTLNSDLIIHISILTNLTEISENFLIFKITSYFHTEKIYNLHLMLHTMAIHIQSLYKQ